MMPLQGGSAQSSTRRVPGQAPQPAPGGIKVDIHQDLIGGNHASAHTASHSSDDG
jgi:hypothetical protein